MTTIGGYPSAYEQAQAWSSRRAAAMDTFNQQNDQLTSSLAGTTDAFGAMMGTNTGSGYFVSNELMSSAIFSATSNLEGEETLIANIIRVRVMKEYAAQQEAQQSQLDGLQSTLSSFGTTA
jgi:hypothetical protein